jgi:nucleoside-diphosphate-sugar epimerase
MSPVKSQCLSHGSWNPNRPAPRRLPRLGLLFAPKKKRDLCDQARRAINDRILEQGPYAVDKQERGILEEELRQLTFRAAIEFMASPRSRLRTRLGYNLAAMSFSAGELAQEMNRHLPEFICTYKPDERQKIADSWPKSIDDTYSRKDWGWKPKFNLRKTVEDMLTNLRLFSVLQTKTPETTSPAKKSTKL